MDTKEIRHLHGKNLISEEIGIYTHVANPEKLHDHDFYEFFYVTSGEYLHEYNGGEKEPLSPGSFVFLKPGDVHLTTPQTRIDGAIRDIIVSPEVFEKLKLLLPEETEYACAHSGSIRQLPLSKLEEIERETGNFLAENDIQVKRCLGIRLIVKLLTGLLPTAGAAEITPVIKKALNSINNNFRRKDCLKLLTRATNYSPTYLYRLFKSQMGCTPGEYLIETRLSYTEYYLKNTGYTLEQIAELVGIESISYLIRIFKKKHGLSPIAYRKNYYAKNKKQTID